MIENKVDSVRFPKEINRMKFKEKKKECTEYLRKLRIEIVETEKDELFLEVNLPAGWTFDLNETNLLDEKGRKRAGMFYKSALWDRAAFIDFNTRYYITYEQPDYDKKLFEPKPEFIEDGFEEEWVPADDREYYELDSSSVFYKKENDREFITTDEGTFELKKIPNLKPNPEYNPNLYWEKQAQPFYYEVRDQDETVLFRSHSVRTDFPYLKELKDEFISNRESKREIALDECKDWLRKHFPDWENELAYWN